jgi:hypothetical protein
VFNIEGFITHIVVFRNGTPAEAADKFIHAGAGWRPLAAGHGEGGTAAAARHQRRHQRQRRRL